MRIIFMGTPEFAIPSLKILVENKYNVVAVVTQPDKPQGRGKKVIYTPVKEYAMNNNINVLQPDKIRKQEHIECIKELEPDLIVTCAFGQILPKSLLDIPKYGCINVHGSLLPRYRGAGPIQWAIINGEKVTGVTTMMMDTGVDTGDMLLKREIQISHDMTAGQLHDVMSVEGAEVLLETIKCLENCSLQREQQQDCFSCYAPLIKKDIGLIDWSKSAEEIYNLIRGTNPWPGAFSFIDGERFRIWKATINIDDLSDRKLPGTIIKIMPEGLLIETGQDRLIVNEIKCDNNKRMSVSQYICGHIIREGDIFG